MHQDRPSRDRGDRRGGLADARDYPDDGEAQIAETMLGGRRLIVRRTRTARRPGRAVARLAALRVHHQPHRRRSRSSRPSTAQHAVVELVIRDLKDQALAHFPSGQFNANAAWTVIAALAHNLLRWTQLLGLPDTTVRAARTLRRRLLAHPRPPDPHAAAGRCTSRPLALARRLHRRARPHPRAPRRRLIVHRPFPTSPAQHDGRSPLPQPPPTRPAEPPKRQPGPVNHAHASDRPPPPQPRQLQPPPPTPAVGSRLRCVAAARGLRPD